LDTVIRKLKNNKVLGEDGLNLELLKCAGNLYNRLLKIFNSILYDGTTSKIWQKAIVISIHKKRGHKKSRKSQRFSLLNTGYKIYASIIKDKLAKYCNVKIGEEQSGFHGRSCCDGYFTLKLIIEKDREFNTEICLIFTYYKKAFDRSNRNKLIELSYRRQHI
jgi:hypothetical protein